MNPGSQSREIFQCGHCDLPVNWSDLAGMCDSCDIWFYKSCRSMSTTEYNNLTEEDSWRCYRCHHDNISSLIPIICSLY